MTSTISDVTVRNSVARGLSAAYLAIAALGAWIGAATPAQSETLESFTVSGWEGSAFSSERTNRFAFCMVTAHYRNGTSLFFKLTGDYQLDIGVSNNNWNFSRGDEFKARLQVDRKAPFTGYGVAALENSVLFPIKTNSSTYNLFRRGRALSVRFGDQTFKYRLDGTSRALRRLDQCVGKHRLFRREVATTAPKAQTDRSQFTIEAITRTTNVISETGIPGFKIITDKDMRKDLGNPDVVWSVGDRLGMTNVLDYDTRYTIDQVAALRSASASGCRETIRSATRLERVNGVEGLIVIAECRTTDGKPLILNNIIVPRPQGGFFEFTFFGDQAVDEVDTAASDDARRLENAALTILTRN